MKIALCPGHHAAAKGATNDLHDLNEFDEARTVVLHAARILISQGHEVTIVEGTLSEKLAQINAEGFDLALDIHFNADADPLDPHDHDNTRGRGGMVMFCPKADTYQHPEPQSIRRSQADAFSLEMTRVLGNKNRGGRPGWHWKNNPPTHKAAFLRRTHAPAFIPELGYIDNNGFAERYLVSGEHAKLAEAIVAGIEATGIGD